MQVALVIAAFTVDDIRLIKKVEMEEKEEDDGWDDSSDDDEEGLEDCFHGICKSLWRSS